MNTDDLDLLTLEAQVRDMRAAELRRLGGVFTAWLRRVTGRAPAPHTV